MREVAERVGLSKSGLFHHFPTKLALYVAVHERILLHIDARLSAAEPPHASALARLRGWVVAIVDTLAEHPTYAPLLLRTLFEDGVVSPEEEAHLNRILERTLGRVSSALRAGMATGELRKVSVAHTLQTLIGMTVYHFASGKFGDGLLHAPVYSADEVRRRKDHVLSFIEQALAA